MELVGHAHQIQLTKRRSHPGIEGDAEDFREAQSGRNPEACQVPKPFELIIHDPNGASEFHPMDWHGQGASLAGREVVVHPRVVWGGEIVSMDHAPKRCWRNLGRVGGLRAFWSSCEQV